MIKKELEILTEFADTVLTEMTVCAETYSTVAEFIEGHTAREDNETEHREEHNEKNLLSLAPTTENGYISVPKVISIN
jgi:Asp-tRNA(Asn)/Glu-tRNA(Gln) amidotransferase C subunit